MSTPAASSAIGWLGEFRDREVESRFRNDSIVNSRRLVLVASLIVLIATVVLAANDREFELFSSGVLTPRNIQGLVALGCCWAAWRARSWRGVYICVWVLAIGIMITNTLIELSRPPDYLVHLGLDALLLIGIYICVPAVKAQFILAAGYSTTLLWMHFTQKAPAYDMADLAVPMTVLLANVLGAVMSVVYNRVKRQFFEQVERERAIRRSLEEARSNVDQLARLLPMCSSCKNIRDDDGYWRDVENYMEAFSGQKITHGICPDCAEKIYGKEITQGLR